MTGRRWLSLIVLATVLGRLAFLVLFNDRLSLQASGYDDYAVNIMAGNGFTRFDDEDPNPFGQDVDSDLPPLYPYFLAGVYKLVARDPLPVALIQIGFDVLVVLLVFWIGRRLAGERVGLWAAAFYGLYPYLLYQNLTLNDTAIFILFLTGGIWAAYQAQATDDWRWAVALGGLFGLGALTKSWVVLVLPLLALWWWRQRDLRAALRLALISGLTLLAVIAPWVARNTLLHDELTFISTNGGSNLHQGNNPCVADHLARGWDAQWVNCIEKEPAGLSEADTDAWHREQALSYLRANLDDWLHLFGTKFWVLWSPAIMPHELPPHAELQDDAVLQYHTTTFQAARIVHLLYFTPLLVLGIVGLVIAWRRGVLVGPLVAVLVAVTVTYVVFHPSTRYRSPADPFVFILAAYALVYLWDRVSGRDRQPTAAPGDAG
jgi:4-amino-4-deoxy-L-arabinose transferase-like glycosyltransferase